MGLSESRREQNFSRQCSATHGFAFLSLTDEKHFKNSRDTVGDSLHSLPVRGAVSPPNTSSLLWVFVAAEPGPAGFGRSQKLVWVLRVSEGC